MKKIFSVILFLVAYAPFFVFANIKIVEVMCNPIGLDTNGEWVKIKNTGTESIDITGWKFNDGSNHNLNIPPKNNGVGDMVLVSGEEAMLANKAENVTGASTVIDTVMSLNNSGDTLALIDGDITVHSITYSVGEGSDEGVLCYKESTSDTDTTTTQSEQQTQTNIITTEVTKYNTVTVEPPQDIYLRLTVPEVSNTGTNARFSAEAYDATGKSISASNVQWSFGDGAVARGREVRHRYSYAGAYIVSAHIKNGDLADESSVAIRIVESDISIQLAENFDFVEVFNNTKDKLDLSGWTLRSGYKQFNIPERTLILPTSSVRFSTGVTKLSTLKREKHVLLLDSARNTVADSREFKQEIELPAQQDAGVSTSTIADVSAAPTTTQPYSAQQDTKGTWYVATTKPQAPTLQPVVETPPMPEPEDLIPEGPQMAAAVVAPSIQKFRFPILNSGVEWLLGLLGIITFGILTLKSFATGREHATINKEDPFLTDDFKITEIK